MSFVVFTGVCLTNFLISKSRCINTAYRYFNNYIAPVTSVYLSTLIVLLFIISINRSGLSWLAFSVGALMIYLRFVIDGKSCIVFKLPIIIWWYLSIHVLMNCINLVWSMVLLACLLLADGIIWFRIIHVNFSGCCCVLLEAITTFDTRISWIRCGWFRLLSSPWDMETLCHIPTAAEVSPSVQESW